VLRPDLRARLLPRGALPVFLPFAYLQCHVFVVLVGLHLKRLGADEVALVARQALVDLPAFFWPTVAAIGVAMFPGSPLVSEHGLLFRSCTEPVFGQSNETK